MFYLFCKFCKTLNLILIKIKVLILLSSILIIYSSSIHTVVKVVVIQKADVTKDSIVIIQLEKPQVKNMVVLGVEKLDISEITGEKDTLIF